MGDILKKLLYAFMLFILGLYIYNGYFKQKDNVIEIRETEDKIKTRNVKYDVGKEYEIEAETQTEDKSNETTYFTVAKALFADLELRGKEAVVDKYRNMVLKGNIIGKSATGWEFYTQEMRYDEKKERFIATTKVKAINKEEKIELESDNFEANKNFTVITLTKNVKIISENFNLTCNRGIYDRERKYIKVMENVKLRAKDLETEKGDIKRISANFNQGIYNMDMAQFTSWGRFTIFYQGYSLKGDNLIYFNNTGDVNIYGDVIITQGDMQTNLSKLYYNKNNQTITLTGPITGTKGNYNFKGNEGLINTETEDLKIVGDIVVYNEKIRLRADEMEFKDKENRLYLYSNLIKLLVLEGTDYKITTKTAEFDTAKEVLYLPKRYKFTKEDVVVEGENLEFDTKTEQGKSENNVVTKKADKLYSDFADFDMRLKKHRLSGRVRGNYEEYEFKGEEAIIDEQRELVISERPFYIENKKENLIIRGSEGTYNNQKQQVNIKKDAEFLRGDYRLNANKIIYNIKEETGTAEGRLKLVNEKDNITATADRAELQPKELYVRGMVEYRMNENVLNTKEALYKLEEEKVYFDNPGTLVNRKEALDIKFVKSVYDKKNNKVDMIDFKGEKEGVNFKSDTAYYISNEKKFVMEKNALIQKENLKISSEKFDYYNETGDIISETDLTISEDGIKVVSKKGKININDKILEGNDAVLSTERGDVVTGDYIFGEFLKKEFNFKGNLKGKMVDGVKFSGDTAKLYFVENMEAKDKIKSINDVENDRFFLTRGEIKNNAEFAYSDIRLKAEFLEIDLDKKIVFGEGTSVLKLDEETDITSDYMYLDIGNETGKMENNVKITNKSELTGVINTSSDRAELDNKNKKVKLSGNVVSYQGKTKIMANEGIYDINTKELSGQGNIQLKYNIENKPDAKRESRREEALKKEAEEQKMLEIKAEEEKKLLETKEEKAEETKMIEIK